MEWCAAYVCYLKDYTYRANWLKYIVRKILPTPLQHYLDMININKPFGYSFSFVDNYTDKLQI